MNGITDRYFLSVAGLEAGASNASLFPSQQATRNVPHGTEQPRPSGSDSAVVSTSDLDSLPPLPRDSMEFLPINGQNRSDNGSVDDALSTTQTYDSDGRAPGRLGTNEQMRPFRNRPPAAAPIAVPSSIAHVFQSPKWKNPVGSKLPENPDTVHLSLFYYADQKLSKKVTKLRSLRPNSRRFQMQLDYVHELQKVLLAILYLIYNTFPDDIKTSKEYRHMLPHEDQRELDGGFSENILFAAQAISRGFRVRGIEQYAEILREPAKQVVAALDALRYVFKMRSLKDPLPPYPNDLGSVLKDFDWAWARFEQRICLCYYTVAMGPPEMTMRGGKRVRLPDEGKQFFAVILCETLLRGVKEGYFTDDHIAGLESGLFYAVPRLSIILGLYHMPHYLDLSNTSFCARWFGVKLPLMRQVQNQLSSLSQEEISSLEKMLCVNLLAAEDDGTNGDQKRATSPLLIDGVDVLSGVASNNEVLIPERPSSLKALFKDVCAIADELASGPNSKDFVDVLQMCFKSHGLSSEDSAIDLSPSASSRSHEELLERQRAEFTQAAQLIYEYDTRRDASLSRSNARRRSP